MTDPDQPTDDELSLALDGEADAELLARIDASAEAQARLEELRAAAALVGSPVAPLDDGTVDDLIGTALDTPMAPPRVTTPSGPRRATPWLVAASVVVLMAIGLSLIWAGRSSDDDQASAAKTTSGQQSSADDADVESSFGDAGASAEAADSAASTASPSGGHGSATTIAPSAMADLPVLYLGAYDDADALRAATATSFADAWKASGSALSYDGSEPVEPTTGASDQGSTNTRTMADAPSLESIDRCAQQLQITLSLKGAPLQRGYASVDDQTVLVYEFAATSARDDKETTLVAAVGVDACDEVTIFER